VATAGAFAQKKGTILFEYWLEIGGNPISNLTGNANYPDNPDESEWRTSLDGPVNEPGGGRGTRIRGYIYPPQTGDYTFDLRFAETDATQNIEMAETVLQAITAYLVEQGLMPEYTDQ